MVSPFRYHTDWLVFPVGPAGKDVTVYVSMGSSQALVVACKLLVTSAERSLYPLAFDRKQHGEWLLLK